MGFLFGSSSRLTIFVIAAGSKNPEIRDIPGSKIQKCQVQNPENPLIPKIEIRALNQKFILEIDVFRNFYYLGIGMFGFVVTSKNGLIFK